MNKEGGTPSGTPGVRGGREKKGDSLRHAGGVTPPSRREAASSTRRCHRGAMTEGVRVGRPSRGDKIPAGTAQRNFPVPRGHAPHPLPPPVVIVCAGGGACRNGRVRIFYTSHFKGGADAPPLEPREGQGRRETPPVAERRHVSAAASVSPGAHWAPGPPSPQGHA